MKFTEEQYRKIVDFKKTYYPWNFLAAREDKSFWKSLFEVHQEIFNFAETNDLENELAAIANPLTREWAHDKFVEKEKKYYWNSIKTDLSGNHLRLFRHGNGGVSSYSRLEPANNINEDEQLTETEIKAWGYNPDMFDREEV
ncbi:hypothetical protein [Leuconostoc pseudomesenteroides]|uniref:hypothetical protein n=1 Tax=Leuconostoc pseudomesenteroides TaxID=33968 RepID=UPI004034FCD6